MEENNDAPVTESIPLPPAPEGDAPAICVVGTNRHGPLAAWIEPEEQETSLEQQIVEAVGPEWEVGAYHSFPSLGKKPSVKDLADISAALGAHDPRLVHWACDYFLGDAQQAVALLAAGYKGYHCSEDAALIEYAKELIEKNELSKDFLDKYVDWEAVNSLPVKTETSHLDHLDWERLGYDMRERVLAMELSGKGVLFNRPQ